MNYNKVIFVCNFAANYGGNFLASLHKLACKLQSHKKDVLFIFPTAAANKHWEVDLAQFKTIFCDFDSKTLTRTIRSFVSPSDQAIIHLHFTDPLLLLLSLKHYMHNRGMFVVHQHMIVNYGCKKVIKGFLLRAFGPRNVVYIGVSPAVYKQLCREVGKDKSRLVVNAIDTERLNPDSLHRNNNILIFGTHYERKGVDLAISALISSPLSSKVTLQVVTHNLEEAASKITTQFGSIPSFVKVIPTSTNARELYDNCFLFLSPSRSEAFGYAVVEAAYSGDRVIASDVPGQNTLKDIPGITWVPTENIEKLQKAIEQAFRSHKQGKEIAASATQSYIRKNYSLNNWTNDVLRIYNQQ